MGKSLSPPVRFLEVIISRTLIRYTSVAGHGRRLEKSYGAICSNELVWPDFRQCWRPDLLWSSPHIRSNKTKGERRRMVYVFGAVSTYHLQRGPFIGEFEGFRIYSTAYIHYVPLCCLNVCFVSINSNFSSKFLFQGVEFLIQLLHGSLAEFPG